MLGWRRSAVVLLSTALLSIAGVAQAQDGDSETQQARELFTEGLGLADQGDWERAVHRFRQALELRDSTNVRFNLAAALGEMGRLVEAIEEADRVLADPGLEAEVRTAVEGLRGELAPRLGQLEVTVIGQNTAGTHVTVDGRPWDAIGAPVRSDPGIRVVRLLHETTELDITEADVPEGGLARVRLEVPADFYASGPIATELDGDGSEAGGGDDAVVIGVTVAVIVAVLVAGGVVAGVLLTQDPQGTTGDFMPGVLDVEG